MKSWYNFEWPVKPDIYPYSQIVKYIGNSRKTFGKIFNPRAILLWYYINNTLSNNVHLAENMNGKGNNQIKIAPYFEVLFFGNDFWVGRVY